MEQTHLLHIHCTLSNSTSAKVVQHGLTEALQAGLDELLPARPLGEVSQGHQRFHGCLGRARFVEPVRTAWGRNSRPGAASWSHPALRNTNTRRMREEEEAACWNESVRFSICPWGCRLHVHACVQPEYCDYPAWTDLCKEVEPLFEFKKPPWDFVTHCSHFLPLTQGKYRLIADIHLHCWVTGKQEGI